MAVEFALVLPLLAMLLLGIVTAGIGFAQAISVANAVREGSRFGATSIPASTAPPYTDLQWTNWAADVNSRTAAMLVDTSAGQATVCTQVWKNSTSVAAVPTQVLSSPACVVGSQNVAGGSAPTPPSVDPNACVVTVWALRQIRINALLINMNPTVRRDSIARYERSC
ncbi:TadE/TadG family type IV pilus assembly protein [Nocardioides mesophilus]|uniref:Pilus assembly protein n=1 Tax=Nocardioides mesophilus TaxID=433659 RepID=A0A7G9RC27_9ACTN|nr:TadE/TadG family type IV pilus assembly protein [Nocardioides mesophilus]QNN53152.1 pilus assembly protein [Nocardioides mesophilus]